MPTSGPIMTNDKGVVVLVYEAPADGVAFFMSLGEVFCLDWQGALLGF